MRIILLIFLGSSLIVVPGCADCRHTLSTKAISWLPYARPIKTEGDLQDALERRWPQERVLAYCKLNPPSDGEQNLVAERRIWKGKLCKNCQKVQVEWYANLENDVVSAYSVTASDRHHYWILEIGNVKGLKTPPYIVKIRPGTMAPGEQYNLKDMFSE
jgi:hypothetical protein